MARKLTWWQAAEIMGVTDRTMRRWRARIKEGGYTSLYDRRKHPSPKKIPLEEAQEVLKLFQEKYSDFNVLHFHEKLASDHGIQLSYTWVKKALQLAGLVKTTKRGKHRKRRPRRPIPGMMLHIDGSKHQWMPGQWHDLIVVLDDATNEIYYAQLVAEESTMTVMAALRAVVERKGWFSSIYSDRASHFFKTPKAGQPVDTRDVTQVGRAMRDLGIRVIPAYSPQARGRGERSFGTWQGRLPQELRLRGIETLEQANAFLRQSYIAEFNSKFTVAAAESGTAFMPLHHSDLNRVFAIQHERTVAKDNTIQFANHIWQLEKTPLRVTFAGLPSLGLPTSGWNLFCRVWPAYVGSVRRCWPIHRNADTPPAAAGFRKSIGFHYAPLRPSGSAGAPFQPTLFRKPRKEKEETIQFQNVIEIRLYCEKFNPTGQITCYENRTSSRATDRRKTKNGKPR